LKPQDHILTELKEIAPALAELSCEMPYRVEKGYFDQLPELMAEKLSIGISSDTIKEPMQVPHHYFEGLAGQILERVNNEAPIEISNIVPIKKMRNWLTYAAAAVFVGVMVIGSFIFSDKKQSVDFAKYQSLDIPSTLDQFTESDLNAYLENNPVISNEDLQENEALVIPNTNEKIQNLSSDKIHHYLNENGYLESTSRDTEN
jgi:hypothetical protein